MTDSQPVDLASVLANMVQQETALLQAHSESVRLQRILVERLLGGSIVQELAGSVTTKPSEHDNRTDLSPPIETLPAMRVPPPMVSVEVPVQPLWSAGVESVTGAESASPAELAGAGQSEADTVTRHSGSNGPADNAAYAARYYRAAAAPGVAPVQPQDLELMRRLREIPEASGLILQFGPHKAEKLGQVAMTDPNYIRQLVIRAQRPEVRAAAARLIEAIDAAAEHKRRASRSTGRRSRASA